MQVDHSIARRACIPPREVVSGLFPKGLSSTEMRCYAKQSTIGYLKPCQLDLQADCENSRLKEKKGNKWRKLPACEAKTASWKLRPQLRATSPFGSQTELLSRNCNPLERNKACNSKGMQNCADVRLLKSLACKQPGNKGNCKGQEQNSLCD